MTEFHMSPCGVFTTKYLLVRKNENKEPILQPDRIVMSTPPSQWDAVCSISDTLPSSRKLEHSCVNTGHLESGGTQ